MSPVSIIIVTATDPIKPNQSAACYPALQNVQVSIFTHDPISENCKLGAHSLPFWSLGSMNENLSL